MSFGGGSGGGSLQTDGDVSLSGPSDNQVLTYNGSSSKWVNKANPTPGIVQLDDFSGSTDDDKLTAAMNFAQAQAQIPAIQFPARVVTLSQTRTPYSGMRLIGPGAPGPKNTEQDDSFASGIVKLNVGNGASSWMNGTGTYFSIYIGNLAFEGNSNAQFWQQSDNDNRLYACQFDSLTFKGFKHVFGQPSAPAHFNQVFFTGHWQVQVLWGTQFTLDGSDCSLWMSGYLNVGEVDTLSGASNEFIMIFSGVGKTDVGMMYVTAGGKALGVLVQSDWSCKLNFYGGEYEGSLAANPSQGSLIRVEGGAVAFFGPWTGYGMANPGTYSHGVIEVTGGNVLIDRPTYARGNSAESVPLVYCSGGKVEIRSAVTNPTETWSGLPVVAKTGSGQVVADSSVTVSSV